MADAILPNQVVEPTQGHTTLALMAAWEIDALVSRRSKAACRVVTAPASRRR